MRPGRTAPAALRRLVVERAGGQCEYCRLSQESQEAAFHLDHILPQNKNLSTKWQEALGPEWKRVQKEWLHTLGNLTLTGYNSKYSDRSFPEKRDMEENGEPKGFRRGDSERYAVWHDQNGWHLRTTTAKVEHQHRTGGPARGPAAPPRGCPRRGRRPFAIGCPAA